MRTGVAIGASLAAVLLAAACTPADPAPGTATAPSTAFRLPSPSTSAVPASPRPTRSRSATPTPTAASPSPTPTSATASRSTPADGAPLIAIDPGHSGRSIRSVDPATGLRDIDYPNYPEIYEVFDVSTCVGTALQADGYRVLMLKEHALDSVGLGDRARAATRAGAALAISVHDDHGQGAGFGAVYDQRGVADASGAYPAMYRGTGAHRTVFDDASVAEKSQTYAKAIAAARTTAEGRRVRITENIYTGRAPLEPGNLALVQLLSRVPWVYNEIGALTAGRTSVAISLDTERRYAEGLLVGIETALPIPGSTLTPGRSAGSELLSGCLRRQVEPKPGQLSRPDAYLPYGFRP